MPKQDTRCGRNSKNALIAFDFDGDSLYLGAPVHLTMHNTLVFDYILQEPPKHIDYLPIQAECNPPPGVCNGSNGIVNISRLAGFNISYADTQGTAFSSETEKSSSFTKGFSEKQAAQNTVGEDAGIATSKVTVDFAFQAKQDFDSHQSSYTGNDASYALTLTACTIADDALNYSARGIDIWRYRIYGTTAPAADGTPGPAYYEVTLPRALCPSNHDPDPTTCPVNPIGGLSLDIYQPWHENGNVLSYPVNANSDGVLAFVPTDLGRGSGRIETMRLLGLKSVYRTKPTRCLTIVCCPSLRLHRGDGMALAVL